jgi:hypothetical protein
MAADDEPSLMWLTSRCHSGRDRTAPRCFIPFKKPSIRPHRSEERDNRPIFSDAKATPVLLTSDQFDTWLEVLTEEALPLQRPFPADQLQVIAVGERKDEAA